MSSLPSSSDVYTGHWIHFSKGAFRGSTITLTATSGAVVVACLALYVNLAGIYLWSLFRYLLYHRRVSSGLNSALHQQQQVLLRNSESALSTSVGFLRLGWYWRLHSRHALFYNSLTSSFGLLFSIALLVAAIMSSFVVDTNNLEVLAQSPNCGFWHTIKRTETTSELGSEAGIAQNARWSQMLSSSSTYSRACYGNNQQTLSSQCNVYSSGTIGWSSDYNAPCPFLADACLQGNNSALKLDTGIIDMAAFGINAASQDRIGMRKVSTCAVAPPDRYTSVSYFVEQPGAGNRGPLPGEQRIDFNFGKSYDGYKSTWTLSSYAINRTLEYTMV
jgi:hypothetical protein